MKIKQSDQDQLEALLLERVKNSGFDSLGDYVKQFKEDVIAGRIKVIKCPATRCFWNVTNKSALKFVCDVIYKYADDSHITTLYRKLYAKHA